MIIRWLKIARAEAVRDFKTALRYPVELCTGLVIMYVLFMALYLGALSLAGGKGLGAGLDGMYAATRGIEPAHGKGLSPRKARESIGGLHAVGI